MKTSHLRDIMGFYNLKAKKNLGQNFLHDTHVLSRIANAPFPSQSGVIIEVGPGPGTLTQSLLAQKAQKIIAIEADAQFLPRLNHLSSQYPGKLEILHADALKVDLNQMTCEPKHIVSNLPYHIGTQLLLNWLTLPFPFETLTLMFQKEVAQRITATVGNKHYGRLSILCQYLCECEILFDVPPQAFIPEPKVTSSVIHMRKRNQTSWVCLKTLNMLTQNIFNQRRKMVKKPLEKIMPHASQVLDKLNISPTQRPENISVQQMIQLTRELMNASKV